MALTGLMTIVGSGLVDGQGFAINSELITNVEQFNTQNVSGAVQQYLSNLSGETKSNAISVLSLAPDFLTGLPPDGIDLGPIDNVIQAVLDQANTLFPNVATFVNTYTNAVSYAVEMFKFKGTVAAAQNTKFEDLGFQYKNYSDVASGGVSSQFDLAYLPTLAKEFKNLGTLFPTKNLTNFGSQSSLATSIIDQGFGYVGNFEKQIKDAKINLNDMTEADSATLNRIMQGINSAALKDVFTGTEFKPYNADLIKNMADITNVKNVFSPDALQAMKDGDTFNDLARKLSNVGGTFKNSTALSDFYGNISGSNFSSLNGFDTMLPPDMAAKLNSVSGKGSGIFGNPTVTDLLGSVGGIGYNKNIKDINQLQSLLLSTDSDILAFKNYLESNQVDINELKNKISAFADKANLVPKFQEGNEKLRNIADKLKLEKDNLSQSKILDNVTTATSVELLKFTEQLHEFSNDRMKLGTADLLNSIVVNDVYGDSIKSCLAEGQNLALLEGAGIDPGTKIDAMSYAKQISG